MIVDDFMEFEFNIVFLSLQPCQPQYIKPNFMHLI